MTTYDVLVTEELLANFLSGERLPSGFRVQGEVAGEDAIGRWRRVRVEDDRAPAWTEGQLVDITFQGDYKPDGTLTRTRVASYALDATMKDIGVASAANPSVAVVTRPGVTT